MSPGKCVLLGTSKSVRRAMKLWDISGDSKFWKVHFHIRYLGALRVGFQVKLVVSAGLHAAEASYASSSSISASRAAVVRAVWSSDMPLAGTPAILNLLDGLVGVDPAFHIICSRFRMMRVYLAHCPEEEPRIFRMLDLICRGAQGHGPVHLLLTSCC